jgi:YhcH/YjgK/YiaL family protein
MRKLFVLRYLLLVTLLVSVSTVLINCNSSKSPDKTLDENKVSEWYNSHKWLSGLELTPNESINQKELYTQYHNNKIYWDEAFNFLKTHDVKTLAPGKYNIDSGNVFAIVSEGVSKIKDSVLWEAHRDFNDLQYIISGKAEMGITPIDDPNVKITVPYSKEEDIQHFTVNEGDKYYPADSSTFFIFSPKEMHRPAIRVDGGNPIKKIVIKVRVSK